MRLREATAALALLLAATPLSAATDFVPGDLFAGIGDGRYRRYSSSGVFLEDLSLGTNAVFTTGCAFDAAGNFYGTSFVENLLTKLDGAHPHGIQWTIATTGNGPTQLNESILLDRNGFLYV